jgi:hypothetical protein
MTIEQLIGAWELRSLYAESVDGERFHPYGELRRSGYSSMRPMAPWRSY